MLKGQKGITLVALVITIIVLLILAGVSISIALQDNGIFSQSKEAVNKYNQAATNEAQQLENTAYTMNDLINNL